jgi:hypothetical protein
MPPEAQSQTQHDEYGRVYSRVEGGVKAPAPNILGKDNL